MEGGAHAATDQQPVRPAPAVPQPSGGVSAGELASIDALCEVSVWAGAGGVPLRLGASLAHRPHAGEGPAADRMIPSVDEAVEQWRWWTEIFRTYRHQGCPYCEAIWRRQEAASVALDMAMSVGRSFDRARQQAIWEESLRKTLVAGVAW